MGNGDAGLRPGELAAIPDARVASQMMPQPVPTLTANQSMYGSINSFNNRMSPGGISPDGRREHMQTINTEEVQDQPDELSGIIKNVYADMVEARARGDIKKEFELSGTLNNLTDQQKYLQGQLKAEQVRLDRGDPIKQFGNYMGAHLATQIAQSVVSAGNTIIGSQKTLAGGDYAGAMVQREKGISQLIGGGAFTLLGALGGSIFGPAGTLAGAGAANQLGNFLFGLPGDISERDLAFSQNYKNALPAMESFYQRFGTDINTKTGEENSRLALDWHSRASDMSYGTGKTTEELMQAAQNRAAYGDLSGEQALAGGRQDIMWERYTGANLANIQRMSGLALRYGGDTDAVQTAFAGLQSSGMGKGRFDEFLTSMQRIMEDGIEKGFVRGADEIAGNMSLLSKLSGGNPLWTGEQGANRLMRMNESISSATDLRTIEDVISFGAVNRLMGEGESVRKDNFNRLKGKSNAEYSGTYVDQMLLLERGMQPELMREQMDAEKRLEGDNYAGQIERYRTMYGLN
jgi:hypothetical protein